MRQSPPQRRYGDGVDKGDSSMKKVLLSIAAVATLAAAAPAMAQPYGSDYGRGPDHERGYNDYYGRGANDVSQRIRQISFRIERGQRDGSLNLREARMLRTQLTQVPY